MRKYWQELNGAMHALVVSPLADFECFGLDREGGSLSGASVRLTDAQQCLIVEQCQWRDHRDPVKRTGKTNS